MFACGFKNVCNFPVFSIKYLIEFQFSSTFFLIMWVILLFQNLFRCPYFLGLRTYLFHMSLFLINRCFLCVLFLYSTCRFPFVQRPSSVVMCVTFLSFVVLSILLNYHDIDSVLTTESLHILSVGGGVSMSMTDIDLCVCLGTVIYKLPFSICGLFVLFFSPLLGWIVVSMTSGDSWIIWTEEKKVRWDKIRQN